MEGNYVETLVSGSSVGPPITTGRSEYGEIKGEMNKQVSVLINYIGKKDVGSA